MTSESFTLSCAAAGTLAVFSALPTAEGLTDALRTLPLPERFGLSETMIRCFAEHVVAFPGEPACYGETLTLLPGVRA